MGCWKFFIVVLALVWVLMALSEAFERMGCYSLSMFPNYRVTVIDQYGFEDTFVTDSIISHDNNHVRFETYKGDTTFYGWYKIEYLKADREQRRREEKEIKEKRRN